MSNNNTGIKIVGPNIGFWSILGIVFLVLKLTHVIDWSWWWVLAPFWIPFTIFMVTAMAMIGIWWWLFRR